MVPGSVWDMTTTIDCDTCLVRGLACHDCVVTVLLGPPPELTLADDECRALDALAGGGFEAVAERPPQPPGALRGATSSTAGRWRLVSEVDSPVIQPA